MSELVSFPPFTLDLVEQRLWKGKKEIALRRKPFAILKHLVENPGRLITHDDLIEQVWGGTTVSESAMRSQLHELRQAVGDGVIETVIGRGYRFVATIEASKSATVAPPPPTVVETIVGRGDELAVLEDALEAATTGRRQICFVTGEPGIGKTTLVDAFVNRLSARGVRWARGHCIEQYGTPEPYLPMIELLGRMKKEPDGEQLIAALVRHAPSFAAHVAHLMSDAQFAEVARRAGPGAEMRTMRELVELLELLGDKPLVLVLEDLQWSDVATIDMLSLLGQRKERTKLLVIATSRRAESQTITHPLNRVMRTLLMRAGATAIALERIERADISSFLAMRFPDHAFPDSFLELIERITAGTPLFMVSILDDLVARHMIEQRDGRWELVMSSEQLASYQPSTVRQLLDIQLDRLAAEEQRVLEAASLVGPAFTVGPVAAALGMQVEQVEDMCMSLVQRALFLTMDGTEEWPGGTYTRFGVMHALVQEVAFERCPVSRRVRWQRMIAEHLEVAYGTRIEEMANVIATHFEQGNVFARAVHYYVLAGNRTAKRFSLADAHRLYSRAQALIPKLQASAERDAMELDVLLGLSQSVTLSSNRQHIPVELFERMIAIARRIGDLPQVYRANVNLYFRHGTLADYDAADATERRLVEIEETSSIAPMLRMVADGARGIVEMWKGNVTRALALLEPITANPENAGPLGGILGQADRIAFLMIYQCTTRWVLGDPERALEDAHRGVAQAKRMNDPYALGATLCILARLRFLRRDDPTLIREAADQVATIAEADVWYAQAALLAAAARSQESGPLPDDELDELLHTFEYRTTTFPMGAPALALPMIETLRIAGRTVQAAALVEEMLDFVYKHHEFLIEPELLRLRGELLEAENREASITAYTQAIRVARERSMRSFELRAEAALARLTAT